MLVYRGALSRGYNSESDRQHTETSKVLIKHAGDSCPYTLRIEPEGGAGTAYMYNGQEVLEFEVSPPGRSGALGNNIVELSGNIARGQFQRTVPFEVQIPSRQKTLAGRYTARLEVSLYSDASSVGELADRQYMELVVDVLPRIDASFGTDPVAHQKSQTLDFGTLRQGQKSSLDFSVTANTGYSIKMVSDNRGVLRHEFTQSSIDYDVFLDGNVVSLEGSPPNDILLSAVTNSHHRMDLLITGNTETGLAGHYSDRLTLVISAD
ncbi:hypothetical protein [Hyphomonas pacifica]|uniref:hypothetical protein n=1 Tax=Hyphomonas pacifica TaxID=1280941 RepID=UPI0011BF0874|nr:hypothetical protein [Hyphomonas pacifica]